MNVISAARPAQVVDPNEARDAARDILGDRRFRSDPAPRPLRGPLQWLGDRLESVVDRIGDILRPVPGLVWLTLGVAAVAVILWRVIIVARQRRVSAASTDASRAADAIAEDADVLERDAEEAERLGDLERAVRLRFRAGLVRLGDRGAIAYRPSVTTDEVRHVLGSDTFEELAHTFEGVAYGGRPAHKPDVDAARRGWPRVLEDSSRR
jgi:hypothetical protein